jgi:Tol biopolymer transport system component
VPANRLDSWKEIAAYLNRDVRTVQRWERDSALPVQRLPGGPKAGVFALRAELDDWLETRRTGFDAAGNGSLAVHHATPRRWWIVWALAGLITAGFLAAAWSATRVLSFPRMLTAQESQFTPFANSSALQVCPAWSPDGKRIAFLSAAAGFPQVFVQGIDNSNAVAITTRDIGLVGGAGPLWCRTPFWSQDSQSLYFFGFRGVQTGVWRVSAGGGPATPVQEGAITASVSPDGKALVFLAASPEDHKLRIWQATPPDGQRHLYRPSPFAVESYTGMPLMHFAPDGQKVFFAMNTGPQTIYQLLPWPPGPVRRVFADAERGLGIPDFNWMPDSQHLAFAAAGLLGMADLQNGHYWPTAIQPQRVTRVAASPDGTRMAFQSSMSHADVVAVPLNGEPPQTLLGSTRTEEMAAASPVAPVIAYVTNRRRPYEIWSRDMAQSLERLLVSPRDVHLLDTEAEWLSSPVFSRDGRRIAFTAVSTAGRATFTMVTAGGPPVRARGGEQMDEVSPSWSPDGEWLAFRSAPARRLFKTRVGGAGPAQALAEACDGETMTEWSPSGQWIAFADEDCQTALVAPDGKSKRRLGGAGAVAWSHDGKMLYRVDPERQALMAMEIAGDAWRVVRPVGDLVPYSGPQPGLRASLSHDGASIVYSVLRPREEIWIMEGVRLKEPWFARFVPFLVRHAN